MAGRILWTLGRRAVEMGLPSGHVRCFDLPVDLRPGSRAVATSTPNQLILLENGSSRLWRLHLGPPSSVDLLTLGKEAAQFRTSLGSRMAFLGSSLLITGTPGPGAHTPWLFDLEAQSWRRLPDAPHPILSSAVTASGDSITIVGGWSKRRGCHGHAQTLHLRQPFRWRASPTNVVPWRRPGAGRMIPQVGLVLALGWMECSGVIGTGDFRLLRRNGSAQGATNSSSRLCVLDGLNWGVAELSRFPCSDSFEHNGEIYPMGEGNVVCIGRDHIQAFSFATSTWQRWPLPKQLAQDGSNSWVKHCGSWSMAWLP